MPDYRKMYTTLFNRITDLSDELKELQQLTEEMYLSSDEAAIRTAPEHKEGVKRKTV